MEYPHKKYLLYLISLQMTPFEIMSDCVSRSLFRPLEKDIIRLQKELGPIPSYWKANYARAGTYFKKWINKKDLASMWRKNTSKSACMHFLYRRSVRKDFEALMLIHGDVDEARDALALKHGEKRVPDIGVLNLFQEYFWDIGNMSADGLYHFLEANSGSPELLPAYQGDVPGVYGRLGLQQRVDAETFYDNIIAFANSRIQRARNNSEMSGNAMMGLAAITRQALDALKAREELQSAVDTPLLDNLKEQASAFHIRVLREEDIPSYDVICLEDKGEEDVG